MPYSAAPRCRRTDGEPVRQPKEGIRTGQFGTVNGLTGGYNAQTITLTMPLSSATSNFARLEVKIN